MKKLLTILFLLITTVCSAETITMPQYSTYDTLTATNLNYRWNLLTNILNGGLNNDNADTDGGYRFIEILTDLPSAGNQGRVVFHKTTNTLNFDTGTSMLATALLANTQTFSGINSFTGGIISTGSDSFTTITNLGTVSTADINGGTLDGVQIGTTTATGELIVNDASDDADGLGSQGSSGQYLKSQGAGSNPTWASTFGTFVSATSFTGATSSGNISLSASKIYKIVFRLSIDGTTDSAITMDNDAAAGAWNYSVDGYELTTGVTDAAAAGAGNVPLGTVEAGNSSYKFMTGEFTISTFAVEDSKIIGTGNIMYTGTGGTYPSVKTVGINFYTVNAVGNLTIDSAQNMTGVVYLYDLSTS